MVSKSLFGGRGERRFLKLAEILLKAKEVRNYLGISQPTLLKYIKEKRINAIKVGRGWRILESEMIRFVGGENHKNVEKAEMPQIIVNQLIMPVDSKSSEIKIESKDLKQKSEKEHSIFLEDVVLNADKERKVFSKVLVRINTMSDAERETNPSYRAMLSLMAIIEAERRKMKDGRNEKNIK
jgi:excisionase family DNA binding protein